MAGPTEDFSLKVVQSQIMTSYLAQVSREVCKGPHLRTVLRGHGEVKDLSLSSGLEILWILYLVLSSEIPILRCHI